jgi:uncharacterized protein
MLLLEMVDTGMEINAEYIKKKVAPILLEAGARKAFLFGSFARDEQTKKSDIDIVIITDDDGPYFKRYDVFEPVYDQFPGREVDLLIYTPSEFEGIQHRKFIRRIMQEGQVIYERE